MDRTGQPTGGFYLSLVAQGLRAPQPLTAAPIVSSTRCRVRTRPADPVRPDGNQD